VVVSSTSKRNQLVYKKEMSVKGSLVVLYEGVRWILFSSR